jgi:hypothetical protein
MDDFRKQFYERWEKLCEEHTAAQYTVLERTRVVNQHPIPVQEELEALEAAHSRMKEIEKRMDEALKIWLDYLRDIG